ncbi:MAG: hypothetical protein ACI8S6_006017 [Myxococcota bacterium]|jgi:hypothetical protein
MSAIEALEALIDRLSNVAINSYGRAMRLPIATPLEADFEELINCVLLCQPYLVSDLVPREIFQILFSISSNSHSWHNSGKDPRVGNEAVEILLKWNSIFESTVYLLSSGHSALEASRDFRDEFGRYPSVIQTRLI